jgi:hypothetical protein
MKNLQLIMNFESIDELKSFITDQEMINTIKIKKIFKKPDDKRGGKTVILHQLAKEYQEKNTDTPYKTCLKIVGKELRNKNQININI